MTKVHATYTMARWLRHNWRLVWLLAAVGVSIAWMLRFLLLWIGGWMTGEWRVLLNLNAIGEGPVEAVLLLSGVLLDAGLVFIWPMIPLQNQWQEPDHNP